MLTQHLRPSGPIAEQMPIEPGPECGGCCFGWVEQTQQMVEIAASMFRWWFLLHGLFGLAYFRFCSLAGMPSMCGSESCSSPKLRLGLDATIFGHDVCSTALFVYSWRYSRDLEADVRSLLYVPESVVRTHRAYFSCWAAQWVFAVLCACAMTIVFWVQPGCLDYYSLIFVGTLGMGFLAFFVMHALALLVLCLHSMRMKCC